MMSPAAACPSTPSDQLGCPCSSIITIPLRRFHAQLLGMATQQVVPAVNAVTGLSSTLLLLVNLLGLAWLGLDWLRFKNQ